MIDLRPDHLATVKGILAAHVPACEVRAFGSRATWTAKDYSDLDLAIAGADPLDRVTLGRLQEAFEESNLPMRVDVLDWHAISEGFRNVITQGYVVVQEREAKQTAAGEWRERPLGELAEIFDGPHATPTKIDDGPVFLGISNLARGRLAMAETAHLSEEDYVRWTRRVEPRAGDIVFAYETRLGQAARIPPGLRCCLGRRMGLLRVHDEEIDARFLLYAYLGPQFQEVLRARTVHGSTVDRIPLSDMPSFPVLVPTDIAEQRAIAHVLGTLDDKIELNRRMNATLEAMARAVFKDWFVDFGPVRAKLAGREPYLPPDVWALFPDRLVDSELGEIPEGWEVGTLSDSIKLLSGGTPRTSVASYWGGDIPWYTAKDAPYPGDVFVLNTERTVTQAGVENSATKILPAGTTLITARGTVGRLACLGVPMAMNQTCYGIRGAPGYSEFFTYWNVRTAVDELQVRTHGTIFDTITRETFKIVEAVLVPANLAEAFESAVGPLMRRILLNLHESRSLIAQRDALLPKLVSGEVRVESQVEHAGLV